MGNNKGMINKLVKANAMGAKKYKDFESIMFAGKQHYHNTAVESANAETYALKMALSQAYERMDAQDKLMIDMMKEINELKTMVMKGIRTGDIHITEEVTTTTKTTVEVKVGRKPKWNKEYAFRQFDHYRREEGLFSNITPEIVKANWSTLAVYSRKYTGMTLGQLLQDYADERNLNY